MCIIISLSVRPVSALPGLFSPPEPFPSAPENRERESEREARERMCVKREASNVEVTAADGIDGTPTSHFCLLSRQSRLGGTFFPLCLSLVLLHSGATKKLHRDFKCTGSVYGVQICVFTSPDMPVRSMNANRASSVTIQSCFR